VFWTDRHDLEGVWRPRDPGRGLEQDVNGALAVDGSVLAKGREWTVSETGLCHHQLCRLRQIPSLSEPQNGYSPEP
jgi:hypothetical protein